MLFALVGTISGAAVAQTGAAGGDVAGAVPAGEADRLQLPSISKIEPTVVARGSLVRVTGENLPERVEDITIDLDGMDLGHPTAASRTSLAFLVPHEYVVAANGKKEQRPVTLGVHLLRISLANSAAQEAPGAWKALPRMTATPFFNGQLSVVEDVQAPLVLTHVIPNVITPATKSITLLGQGFRGPSSDFEVLLDGQSLPVCWSSTCSGSRARLVSAHELVVIGPFDETWREGREGVRRISIRRGDSISEEVALRVADFDAWLIRLLAGVIALALLGAPAAVALRGGERHKIAGREYAARAFLLDTETDTYSLSKLQFYLWTCAALFGYCYLALARALVQGHLDVVDVPENLPGLLGVSAGTSVLSVGISAMRGPKGAGSVHPSFSDLVSTAGVVSPERFQLLLWTIVGVSSFLFVVLQRDPLDITTLPAVPEGLIYLSGVSSIGYLGGKLVRGPGPVISDIMAERGSLQLTIIGRFLSPDASFSIDRTSLTQHLQKPAGTSASMPGASWKPVVVEAEDNQDTDRPRFAKILKLAISADSAEITSLLSSSAEPLFTIWNPDGQSASWRFKIVEPPLEPAPLPAAGASSMAVG